MFFYKFHIGDYASHTRHLSPLEDIAYRRLLDLCYTSEKAIPKDIRQLSRLINMREYQAEIQDVLNEFFHEVEEGWINHRVLKEIEDFCKKSEAAKKSVEVRWEKHRKTNAVRTKNGSDTNVSEEDTNVTQNDTNHKPLTKNHNPFNAIAYLVGFGGNTDLVQEFLKIRKSKKKANTERALKPLVSEMLAFSQDINEALNICCVKTWADFNSRWSIDGYSNKPAQDISQFNFA